MYFFLKKKGEAKTKKCVVRAATNWQPAAGGIRTPRILKGN